MKRVIGILNKLDSLYPRPLISLNYSNTWELLVAVMLSAQCTDKKVNEVTSKLFIKYPTLGHFANADLAKFEKDIYSTGFYKNKAKNIIASAKIVSKKFKGQVPNSMDELLRLPGVARKTANVVLCFGYSKTEGIAVDTHVLRLSNLLGLAKGKDPEKVERELMKKIPQNKWCRFTVQLISYGREYCPARKHNHKGCPLKAYIVE